MTRYKVQAIDPKACQCCGLAVATQKHHRHPKSQNGSDDPENTPSVCDGCHDLYNVNNQTLAKTPEARARNFQLWLDQWPDAKMECCGKKRGPNPYIMAPDWVVREWSNMMTAGETDDLPKGCLSALGKIITYPKKTWEE